MIKFKFEINNTYESRSICDNECIFKINVISRTAKTISYKYLNQVRRSSVKFDSQGNEYIKPDNYSMAPIFRAERQATSLTA